MPIQINGKLRLKQYYVNKMLTTIPNIFTDHKKYGNGKRCKGRISESFGRRRRNIRLYSRSIAGELKNTPSVYDEIISILQLSRCQFLLNTIDSFRSSTNTITTVILRRLEIHSLNNRMLLLFSKEAIFRRKLAKLFQSCRRTDILRHYQVRNLQGDAAESI